MSRERVCPWKANQKWEILIDPSLSGQLLRRKLWALQKAPYGGRSDDRGGHTGGAPRSQAPGGDGGERTHRVLSPNHSPAGKMDQEPPVMLWHDRQL